MKEKILYITDLDGTLLNNSKEVSDFAKTTLNALIANGVNFSIASARTAASATKILSGLNINIPVVLMNGVIIYDIQRNNYIKTEYIPVNAVEAVLNTLEQSGITGFMYAVRNDNLVTYYENLDSPAMKDFYDERVRKYYKSFAQVDKFSQQVIENEIVYFTLVDEYERLSAVLKSLETYKDINAVLYRDIYAEKLWYLEIHSKSASKRNAVNFLREYGKFSRVVGFGDNLNDIPLFMASDECYAVSNAVRELKEIATGVIGDNNGDAVAKFVYDREAGRGGSTL